MWQDAPPPHGPHGTLHNRFVGVFHRIFAGHAAEAGSPDQPVIDATHLKARRTAASLLDKGLLRAASAHRGRLGQQTAQDRRRVATRYDRCARPFMCAIPLAATVLAPTLARRSDGSSKPVDQLSSAAASS